MRYEFYLFVQVKVRGRDSVLGPYCYSESDLDCMCECWKLLFH